MGCAVAQPRGSPCPRRLEAPRLDCRFHAPPTTARNSADAASPSIPSTCHHRGMGERLARSAWRGPQVYGPASAHARSAVGGTEGCCILRGQERNHEFFTASTLPNPRSGDPSSRSKRSDSRGCLGVRVVATQGAACSTDTLRLINSFEQRHGFTHLEPPHRLARASLAIFGEPRKTSGLRVRPSVVSAT